jgi:hypothetical protein
MLPLYMPITEILPLGESYIASMKWAVRKWAVHIFAISHSVLMLDACHGLRILLGYDGNRNTCTWNRNKPKSQNYTS